MQNGAQETLRLIEVFHLPFFGETKLNLGVTAIYGWNFHHYTFCIDVSSEA